MEQNPKSIDATVIAKDAVDDEPTVATRSKKKKRASGRARGVTAVPQKASAPSQAVVVVAKSKKSVASEPILKNRVRETRIERMMSKAELARRAGISVLTIDRVEKGLGCRMDTKRKILEALGLSLADRVRVFGEEE